MAKVQIIEAGTVEAGGRVLPVALRCDPRARRLTLRLVGDTVRVTCPSKRHRRDALRLVEARRGWIAERLDERPAPARLAVGERVVVFGQARVIEAGPVRSAARLEEARIVTGGDTPDAVARRVTACLRKASLSWFEAEAARLGAALGLPPCPVRVRQMRSRWGSCSAAPSLSFDWRLCLAPPGTAAYVAAHEVAHRRHMHHGPAFWAEVEGLMPGYEPHAAWLRREGASLHAYGG